MAVITRKNIVKFVWRYIVCRNVLRYMIIRENGKQFTDNSFKKWSENNSINKKLSSVGHPQANGQVEVTNRKIIKEIKRRLGKVKGNWVDKLLHVLWSYRTATRTPTKQNPFSLVYGTKFFVPVEVSMQTTRTSNIILKMNESSLRIRLDFMEECRQNTVKHQSTYKALTKKCHSKRLPRRLCKVRDLVLR